ncbi:MAG: hypothetical protein HQ518_23645 [Rhodopirellula sp.]|nr:hypothetical protein [Rhodopirellula sp.]
MSFLKNPLNQQSDPTPSTCREFVLAVGYSILVCCVGCGYPEVSPKTYEISKALYSMCSLKREQDLARVTDVISQARDAQELSDSESAWLMAIVGQAQKGKWQSAASEARKILEDQTGR